MGRDEESDAVSGKVQEWRESATCYCQATREYVRDGATRREGHVCHLETAGLDESSLEPSTSVEFDRTSWLRAVAGVRVCVVLPAWRVRTALTKANARRRTERSPPVNNRSTNRTNERLPHTLSR